MAADPILLEAGRWLGVASGVLALLMVVAFLARWGIRFRLVGITSFTTLLAISCAAFAISYSPRLAIEGAVSVPVVFDNGATLVVAAAPADLPPEAAIPTVRQVAANLRGSGRNTPDGLVTVRLRRVERVGEGLSRPVVLAEAQRDLVSGSITLRDGTGRSGAR
ncbi:MAG: Ycf51 family protein [Cyanobacteriota bacterium]